MDSAITPCQQQLINAMTGFVVCKDLRSTYIYVNRQNAALLGLPNQQTAIGMTDLDLPCGLVESALQFQEQDREVIHSGQPLRILEIHRYPDQKWRTLFARKAPLRDEEHNIVGSIGLAHELNGCELLELGAVLGKIADRPMSGFGRLSSTSYTIGRPNCPAQISQLQQAILFVLLRGRAVRLRGSPARLIGRVLGIAPPTVERNLCQLKEQFAVLSISELIDKAIERGYRHNLPPGLSMRSLSMVLRED